jgi:hypothetical protein
LIWTLVLSLFVRSSRSSRGMLGRFTLTIGRLSLWWVCSVVVKLIVRSFGRSFVRSFVHKSRCCCSFCQQIDNWPCMLSPWNYRYLQCLVLVLISTTPFSPPGRYMTTRPTYYSKNKCNCAIKSDCCNLYQVHGSDHSTIYHDVKPIAAFVRLLHCKSILLGMPGQLTYESCWPHTRTL